MTSGSGTKSIPKDILFENILRQKFHKDKFEKILYYDACIIVKDGKNYGKIIICDDSIYSYYDALQKFTVAALFQDIYSVEMISDVPEFVFGYMKNKNIHIRIKFYKRVPIKRDHPTKQSICCRVPGGVRPPRSERDSSAINNSNNSSMNETDKMLLLQTKTRKGALDDVQLVEDSIDFYILNLHSAAFHLLKRARIDFLIRETLSMTLSNGTTPLYLSSTLVNRLFNDLSLDVTMSKNSLTVLREYLLELLESGLKYTGIKGLFWSKPNLFKVMVSQFVNECKRLMSIDTGSLDGFGCLNVLNVLLQVFNTFSTETDHLVTKLHQLRIENGKVTLSLIQSVLSTIAYLNDCDQKEDATELTDHLEVDIDCLKHSVSIGSVQLLYHLICSSEVPIADGDEDLFTIRTIAQLLESLITYDSSDGIFNRFLNQTLRMQFIWIFPRMFKFSDDQPLSAERVITVYQFFNFLRALVQCVPKFSQVYKEEMKEEFEHFTINDRLFPSELPLSLLALKLLKSFQKNMIYSTEIFIDYY